MPSDLKDLLELQELDQEIIELNAQLARYPAIWEETKQKMTRRKAAFDSAEAEKTAHQNERQRAEQKLRVYSEDLRRAQVKAATIKTSKEYEAINKQIEATKLRIAEVEERGVALIDQQAAIDEAVKKARTEYEEMAGFYKTEKARIREQFNEKKSRVDELEVAKKEIAGRLTSEMLETYERISRRHPGTAVVPVRSGSCTGCHFSLLPDSLVQVHRQETLVHCPNCGRLLSHDEEHVEEEVPSV